MGLARLVIRILDEIISLIFSICGCCEDPEVSCPDASSPNEAVAAGAAVENAVYPDEGEENDFRTHRATTDEEELEEEGDGESSGERYHAYYMRNIHPDVMRGRGSFSEYGTHSSRSRGSSDSEWNGPPFDDEEYNHDS